MRIPSPSAKSMVKFHLFMMILWLSMLPVTLIWLRESILWIAFMSLYANFVGHFGAFDAARAEESSE